MLELPDGPAWLLDHVLQEREVGQYLARSGRAWAAGAEPRAIADFLIGGMAKEDVVDGDGLFYGSSEPTDMVLPPLPNLMFQRDPSCWIYDGVTLNPMTKPARQPETASWRRSTASTRCSPRTAA